MNDHTTGARVTGAFGGAVAASPTSAGSDTAGNMLPAELLLEILSLCESSSLVPTTCRAFSSDLFIPGAQPHRAWSHRHIFLDPQYDPQVASIHDGPSASADPWGPHNINELYSRVAQIQSRLSFYLKTRVPAAEYDEDTRHPYAAGIAPPEGGTEPETMAKASVLSAEFVDWLFSNKGPFGRGQCGLDVVVELRKRRKLELDKEAYMSGEDDEFDDECPLAFVDFSDDEDDQVQEPRPRVVSGWQLVPDALLLAHFFIRTTQLDLLERTLVHLRAALPAIATASAPISVWSFCMLDNRTELRSNLSDLAAPSDETPITYPTFLCLLALFDWSKPALNVISRVFADSLDLRTVFKWIHDHPPAFYCMLETLDLVTSPPSTSDRVLAILDLFRQNGVPIDYASFGCISSSITGCYCTYVDVLLRFDLPNMPRPLDASARFSIGLVIVSWVRKGHVDVIDVALEHGFLGEFAVQELDAHVAFSGDQALAAKMAAARI